MSNYNHNNANKQIVEIIQQLQQWNKKPSLNDKISEFLDIFHESINKGQINFAEAGLFLQESSILNGKQIDLLYKSFLEIHKNLSDVYNDDKIQDEIKENKKIIEPEKIKKERKKCDKKKVEIPEKEIESEDLTNEPEEKFSIPGIPDEILERLKLSDCLPGGPIDEFIDRLNKDHPLYSIISKLGKEISQNKDIFTYNNLSLSGMSWNALFKIEEVLSRITRKDDLDQCEQTQIDDDSGIDTDHFTETIDVAESVPIEESIPIEESVPTEESIPIEESVQVEESNKNVVLTEELKKNITKECVEKIVKINLLKLDYKVLMKKFHFRLPPEYFAERRSERLKRKSEEDSTKPKKRKKNIDIFTQKHKSFDLELFENFCYNYYESQGIILPRPQTIQLNRKSIDNRSEVSYGNPLTPADSGRFSLSFMTDSEFDHCDTDDNCRDSTLPFSRADSGIEAMRSFSPEYPDDLQKSEENDTLKTLRTLFPATFSDPQRVEALKTLYKQPEDDENYMEWKKFIDDKTSNEQEFNIHEYGTDILNSFSSHSTNKLSFSTIIEDKSVEEISRYFVSTLQLANTYNVEIIDKYPGEIRPDNMELKFLTNTRIHEEIDSHLNDISEDHFMDNLILNTAKNFHSTPKHPESIPGPSTHKFAKRKRLEYCY